MNIQKFTQKSVEALQDCEKLAYEYGNQEIDQEHLLRSLVDLDDSLIASLLENMGVDLAVFRSEVIVRPRCRVMWNSISARLLIRYCFVPRMRLRAWEISMFL